MDSNVLKFRRRPKVADSRFEEVFTPSFATPQMKIRNVLYLCDSYYWNDDPDLDIPRISEVVEIVERIIRDVTFESTFLNLVKVVTDEGQVCVMLSGNCDRLPTPPEDARPHFCLSVVAIDQDPETMSRYRQTVIKPLHYPMIESVKNRAVIKLCDAIADLAEDSEGAAYVNEEEQYCAEYNNGNRKIFIFLDVFGGFVA